MTDNRTTELLLDMLHAFLVDYQNILKAAISEEISEKETIARQRAITREHAERIEQAIAATLCDDDYECRMDELLCRLTNGKWSKSRSYSVDFMVSCVDEAYEDAALGEKRTCETCDELGNADSFINHLIQAERHEGTCHIVASSTDGLCSDNPRQYFELSCGHSFTIDGLERPIECAVCGKKVSP